MISIKRIQIFLPVILAFLLAGQNGYGSQKQNFFIEAYGGAGDGTTLNTAAIQKAIDTAAADGGGRIVFSSGKYLSGTLVLKSGIELHIKPDAVLLGSTCPEHYHRLTPADAPVSPKEDDNSKLALLLAHNASHISITGNGTIDGQGRELALTIDSLHFKGIRIDPNYNTWHGRPSETARPKIINFTDCRHVTIKDVTIQDAACWVQSYERCICLVLDRVKVRSRAYWNNDGMDITDCKNVQITRCDVNSADDGICLKSYYPGFYCDSIYIADCTIRSSASAIKFGTASIGGFKNVIIENIDIFDTYRSAVAIETVDGGFIENVSVSDVRAENTGNALFIRIGHRSGEKPGRIKNITIRNMTVQIPFGRPDAGYDMYGPALPFFHNPFPAPITGIPGYAVEDITLENIQITSPGRASKGMAYIPLWRLDAIPEKIRDYPEYSMFGELPAWGFYVRHVKGIVMKNITLKLKDEDFRPAIVFDDVERIRINGLKLPQRKNHQIILKDTRDVRLDRESESTVKRY